jgi:hypothetical protein
MTFSRMPSDDVQRGCRTDCLVLPIKEDIGNEDK